MEPKTSQNGRPGQRFQAVGAILEAFVFRVAPTRPKMAPRWPKMVTKWPKMASRWAQNGTRKARMVQRCTKMTPTLCHILIKMGRQNEPEALKFSEAFPLSRGWLGRWVDGLVCWRTKSNIGYKAVG